MIENWQTAIQAMKQASEKNKQLNLDLYKAKAESKHWAKEYTRLKKEIEWAINQFNSSINPNEIRSRLTKALEPHQ